MIVSRIILKKIKLAKTPFAKTRGMIGFTSPISIFFETRFGIHTFFMRAPIDIIILDGKERVVAIKKGLKPNRLFFWNPVYKKVVELPEKTIEGKKIKLRDQIILEQG